MIKLFVAIPTLGTREDSQTYTLRRIEKKYSDKIQFVYPEHFVGRMFHDHARNKLVEEFLNSDCDLVWFLDGDVVPPDDVLDLITIHGDNWKLAGAVYPVFIVPPGMQDKEIVFTVYRRYEGRDGLAAATFIPTQGTDFVEGIATGCIFIKREIFSKLQKPYFEFKYDEETRDIKEGEDLGFCLKTDKLGEKFFVDFSLVCHHMKKVSLLEMNNYAMQYGQRCVANHERAIRQAIAKKKLLNKSQQESRLILPK